MLSSTFSRLTNPASVANIARRQALRAPIAARNLATMSAPTSLTKDPSRSSINGASSYLSNVSDFKIIESTLREGEQFANAFFTTEKKIEIAKALDDFGVEYLELTSPAASTQSYNDCRAIVDLNLNAKILTHVRCHMDDAKLAVQTGVDGLDVVIGTSSFLREFSHGKDMQYIIDTATEVI
ncbi:homocitrate synthase lys21, partial [Coemansia sp. RSA 485]